MIWEIPSRENKVASRRERGSEKKKEFKQQRDRECV